MPETTETSLRVPVSDEVGKHKGHKIRTIHRTEEYPGLTMLSKDSVPANLINKIRESLFSIDQNDKGKNVLKKISMPGFGKLNLDQLEKIRPYLPSKKSI